METQVKSVNHNRFKILLYGFLLLVFAFAIWIGFVKYRSSQEQKQSRVFIGQIINSVIEDTEFYKDNSDEDVIVELQINRNVMSNSYVISTIDYSWGVYEAQVLFDNKIKIKMDVTIRNNKLFLLHFRMLQK